MSQNDFSIANQAFPATRSDINSAFQALASTSSGSSEPGTMFAQQLWMDTSATPWVLKIRNAANDAWITWFNIDDSDDTVSAALKALTMTGALLATGGSVGTPSLSFSGDTDTGFYSSGADETGVSAGGSQVAAFGATFAQFSEAFRLSGTLSPAQITSNTNNYNPSGLANASQLRLNSDASRNITGLSGGVTGRLILIANIGSTDIVLTNQDALSTAANRFLFAGGDRTLTADEAVLLRYDGTSSRWRAAQDSLAGGITRGTVKTPTSGATVTFEGIAAGTDLIHVMFFDVSLNGNDDMIIQLGDSGGYETSGYGGFGSNRSGELHDGTGMLITFNMLDANQVGGVITLARIDGNKWGMSGNLSDDTGTAPFRASGQKELTGELTQLRIATDGANQFSAGTINILTQ